MNKLTKTFNMPEDLYEKLLTVQHEKSFSTVSATLQFCISDVYDRQMRNERRVKKLVPLEDKLDIEERRKDKEMEKCKTIAEKLQGKLIKDGDGYIVEYYTHSKQGSYKQAVPLLSLTEGLVDKQWFPSREIVEGYINNKNK